jgi:hypothetical protein
MILGINSDYLHKQHQPIDLCNNFVFFDVEIQFLNINLLRLKRVNTSNVLKLGSENSKLLFLFAIKMP